MYTYNKIVAATIGMHRNIINIVYNKDNSHELRSDLEGIKRK